MSTPEQKKPEDKASAVANRDKQKKDLIRAALDGAEDVASARFAWPEPGTNMLVDGESLPPGKWEGDELGLPPRCPVTPLGYEDNIMYLLTPRGTLFPMNANSAGQTHMEFMFAGSINYLFWAWPSRYKDASINTSRFAAEAARRVLIDACAFKRAWSPKDRFRGRGASLNEYGQMVFHTGAAVYVNGYDDHPEKPGEIGRFLYPALDAGPKPWGNPEPADIYNAARQVYEHVLTWNWARGALDAQLYVAWIGCAMFGGALGWRPHIAITGDKSTGKSTLHKLTECVMGANIVQTSDTTAAGIYQSLKHDTIAVLFDEAEGSEDDRSVQAVINLLITASSGSKILRGGAEHNHVEFILRSCFMLSAVNLPSLKPTARSRIAILDLHPFEQGSKAPEFNVGVLAENGRKMMRRIMDNWSALDKAVVIFRNGLIDGLQVDSRFGDQYGTLAAMWFVMTRDGVPAAADVKDWVSRLSPMATREKAQNVDNWRGCLDHLIETPISLWQNRTYRSVRALLVRYYQPGPEADGIDFPAVRDQLAEIGLAIVKPNGLVSRDTNFLFIPSSHAALREVFARSAWKSGAADRGVWSAALKRAPEDIRGKQGSARVGGKVAWGTMIRISAFIEFEEG